MSENQHKNPENPQISCPNCNNLGHFLHIHDAAHGIPQTHMVGTERYECPSCSHALFKAEGEKLGLWYTLD